MIPAEPLSVATELQGVAVAKLGGAERSGHASIVTWLGSKTTQAMPELIELAMSTIGRQTSTYFYGRAVSVLPDAFPALTR